MVYNTWFIFDEFLLGSKRPLTFWASHPTQTVARVQVATTHDHTDV